ncbi:hypothetical protein BX666DRAFT_1929824 [Dichotomocladium elegans]|nr:hypothetical protein BX666DRAFT_1929824 [Dichotomocladium elegans]
MRLHTLLSTAWSKIFKKSQSQQQRQPDHRSTIIRLPDEILLKIILYTASRMGLEGLHSIANVCQKFRCLSADLMRRYILPGIRLATLIDQEGRRRFKTVYHFHSLDDNTLVATFVPVSRQAPRRMRSSSHAALPVLRQLFAAVADKRTCQFLSPQNLRAHQDRQRPGHAFKSLSSTNTKSHQHSNGKIKIKPKTLRIAKPGNHVSVSPQKMRNAIRLWQLHYSVNPDDESNDCYITVTCMRVHLSLLIRTFAVIPQWEQKPKAEQQYMHHRHDGATARKAPH